MKELEVEVMTLRRVVNEFAFATKGWKAELTTKKKGGRDGKSGKK